MGNVVGQIGEEVAESLYDNIQGIHKKLEEQFVQTMDGNKGAQIIRSPLVSFRNLTIKNCTCCSTCNDYYENPLSSSSSTITRTTNPSVITTFCTALPRYLSLALPFFIGACFIGAQNNWSIIETIYFIAATITTIGYGGDYTPQTDVAKLCIILVMPFAVFATGRVLGYYAKAYATAQVIRRVEAVLFQDGFQESLLNLMDLDGDSKVTRSEYLQFMLLALKKVDREFLDKIEMQFDRLDANGNGELDKEDIVQRVKTSERISQRMSFMRAMDEEERRWWWRWMRPCSRSCMDDDDIYEGGVINDDGISHDESHPKEPSYRNLI